MGRRRHTYEYGYGYSESSPYRERIRRNPALAVLDGVLLFLVIPVPVVGVALELFHMALIPTVWLAAYSAVVLTSAGLLFLILTACGVGGFGKVGYFFTHTHGKRWMSTKEAKGNTYFFGFIMLVIGLLAVLWTVKIL